MFEFIKSLFTKDTTSSETDILTDDDFIQTDFSGSAFADDIKGGDR